MVLQAVLLSISVATMVGVIIIGALVFKTRKDKMMKAASPPLLYLMLIGAFLLHGEVIVGWFPAGKVTCVVRPWIRHMGFAITYGALLMKTWRISVIMRLVKAKFTHTKDGQLFQAVAVIILVSAVYMLVWTVADPVTPKLLQQHPKDTEDGVITTSAPPSEWVCTLPWWDYVISSAEFCFLVWGGMLCYQARKAPDIYNESRPISYALWNEALWVVFYIFASSVLSMTPNLNMSYVLCFLRVQCTTTVTLLLLFVPKFQTIFSTLRELRGTTADVYGAKRIHRLSLMMNKSGVIKNIYCVPCGPLTYTEGPEEEPQEDSTSETGDTRENHYTKAEVDTLIEMVARLKKEKALYKTQVKRLYHLLKEYKHKLPINGLPVYLVAETPEAEQYKSPITGTSLPETPIPNEIDGLNLPNTPSGELTPAAIWQDLSSNYLNSHSQQDDTIGDVTVDVHNDVNYNLGATNYGYNMVPHSRKASTVTTYLSTTPDDNSWTGDDGSDMLKQELLGHDRKCDVSSNQSTHVVTSPVVECVENGELSNSVKDIADIQPNGSGDRTDLTLDIPEHSKCTAESPGSLDDLEGFPRLVQTQGNKTHEEYPQDFRDFISTICGKVKDNNKTKVKGKASKDVEEYPPCIDNDTTVKSHEMDTLKNGKSNILSSAVKMSAKAFDRRLKGSRKASDKMSFVMYI